MNVSTLFTNPYASTTSTASTSSVGAVSSTTSTASTASSASAASSTSISSAGQLFSQLQQLSQSNPTEFKAVASQLATTFQTAASQTGGPQAKALTNLSDQMTQAAQTGALQAPQSGQGSSSSSGAGGHHHHHHGGGGGDGSSSSSSSSAVQVALQTALGVVSQATSDGTTVST